MPSRLVTIRIADDTAAEIERLHVYVTKRTTAKELLDMLRREVVLFTAGSVTMTSLVVRDESGRTLLILPKALMFDAMNLTGQLATEFVVVCTRRHQELQKRKYGVTLLYLFLVFFLSFSCLLACSLAHY